MRICFLACCLVLNLTSYASELPPIDEIMTREEMSMTGLDKLSADELQTLREWLSVFIERDAKFVIRNYEKQKKEQLRTKAADEIPEAPQTVKAEAEEKENPFENQQSTIEGIFSGWSGNTRFTLTNGQVWQQRKPDSVRRVKPIRNPKVVFSRNFLGFYYMEVPEAGVKVAVKRIK